MAMNLPQVASYSAFKIRHEHFHVALMAASLLPSILKTKQETTHDLDYLWFVNDHVNFYTLFSIEYLAITTLTLLLGKEFIFLQGIKENIYF